MVTEMDIEEDTIQSVYHAECEIGEAFAAGGATQPVMGDVT